MDAVACCRMLLDSLTCGHVGLTARVFGPCGTHFSPVSPEDVKGEARLAGVLEIGRRERIGMPLHMRRGARCSAPELDCRNSGRRGARLARHVCALRCSLSLRSLSLSKGSETRISTSATAPTLSLP